MSYIFHFIILIGLVFVFVLFIVLFVIFTGGAGTYVKAGSNASKFEIDMIFKSLKRTPKPASDKVEVTETIKRWRMVTGILFASVFLFILIFYIASYHPERWKGFSPWAYYAFFIVLGATIFTFLMLNKKEKESKRK